MTVTNLMPKANPQQASSSTKMAANSGDASPAEAEQGKLTGQIADNIKKIEKLEAENRRLANSIAPWGLRYGFAAIVVVATAAALALAARGILTAAEDWLGLAYLTLLLAAWCSTVWAAFWYTRTLR